MEVAKNMTLYSQQEMRPEHTFIDLVLKVYKLAKVKDQYMPEKASNVTFFDTPKGYDYQILGETSDFLMIKNLSKLSWDEDYEGFSGSCSFELPYNKQYLEYLVKGAYLELYVNRIPIGTDVEKLRRLDAEEYKQADQESQKAVNEEFSYPVTYPYLECSFAGFIKDIKYEPSGFDVSCTSYGAVLEEKASLSFENTKRSQILSEIIYTAGLNPNVDATGLYDETISWSSTKNNSTEDATTGQEQFGDDCTPTQEMSCLNGVSSANNYGSGHNFDDCYKKGYAVKDSNYYKWAKQFKTGEEMLRALRKTWRYEFYYNNRTCPQKVFNPNGWHANCYDSARVVKCLCDSIGFPCVIVTGHAYGYGHGFNVIKTKGKWLSLDLCFGSRANPTNSTNMSMIF